MRGGPCWYIRCKGIYCSSSKNVKAVYSFIIIIVSAENHFHSTSLHFHFSFAVYFFLSEKKEVFRLAYSHEISSEGREKQESRKENRRGKEFLMKTIKCIV